MTIFDRYTKQFDFNRQRVLISIVIFFCTSSKLIGVYFQKPPENMTSSDRKKKIRIYRVSFLHAEVLQ